MRTGDPAAPFSNGAEPKPPDSRQSRFPVMFVGSFLSRTRGGNPQVGEILAAGLTAAGWPVITTSEQPRRLARLLDMLGTVWRHRRDFAVAHVEVYSGRAFLWAEAVCWLLRRLDKPYMLALHGGDLPLLARRQPLRVRRLLATTPVVTAPSSFLRERLIACKSNIRILRNALDLETYPFRLRVAPRPRLVWLRALHEIYNPVLAVRVLADLVRDHPEAELLMVGPAKDDSALAVQEVALELGVADRLTLAGGVPKPDVPHWLDRGDIFLNTTNIDNSPVSVVEAMACGLCVVSTDVGGLPYLLRDGKSALLVPPDESPAMAAAVRRILGNPSLAAHLSQQARVQAEAFDWPVIYKQLTAFLMTAGDRSGH